MLSETQCADRLWANYQRTHDPKVRAAIVDQFEPLARALARRFARRGCPHSGRSANEDLRQVAMLGLVKAVDRFDPEAHVRFSTFAAPTILGELRHYLRSHGWYIHVPRAMQELAQQVRRAESQMTERLGRRPTPAELAARLDLSEEKVQEALALREVNQPLSLDGVTEAPEGERALSHCLGGEDAALQDAEDRVGMRQALGQLDGPMRQIILLRYMSQMSQRDVARQMGFSPMKVCRLEKRALDQLRHEFT